MVLTPWPEAPGDLERSNRETIAALGGVEVLTLAEIDLPTRTAGRRSTCSEPRQTAPQIAASEPRRFRRPRT